MFKHLTTKTTVVPPLHYSKLVTRAITAKIPFLRVCRPCTKASFDQRGKPINFKSSLVVTSHIEYKATLKKMSTLSDPVTTYFVPPMVETSKESISLLVKFLIEATAKGGRDNVVVLTGAGCSTESGIPDYRSPNGSYSVGHKPILHSEFMESENSRKRYWARSIEGYQYFANRQPNDCHHAVHHLHELG